jgi:hypothetical protein
MNKYLIDGQIHFGLVFAKDFPLEYRIQHQIARQLLLNPYISCEKVFSLINNRQLWLTIKPIITVFDCDVSGIAFAEMEYKGNEFDEELFIEKIIDWVQAFSFPTIKELIEISELTGITEDSLLELFLRMLFELKLKSEKIIDYLSQFAEKLPSNVIDDLLDLYLLKTVQNPKNR